jgi:hypothetical protein
MLRTWAALMLHRRAGGAECWSLALLLVLVLGVLVGTTTGFWLGVSLVGALMTIAAVVKAIDQEGGPSP